MQRLLRALDHAILWPLSNWLWANIVDHLLTSLRQITPRRMVYLAAFVIFAWAAAEWYFSADVAMLLVGDSALYIEIVTFAYIAVARTRVDRILTPAMRRLRLGLRRTAGTIARSPTRAKRAARRPRLFDNEDSGDVPDGAFAFS
jgi:hypothetical protein